MRSSERCDNFKAVDYLIDPSLNFHGDCTAVKVGDMKLVCV